MKTEAEKKLQKRIHFIAEVMFKKDISDKQFRQYVINCLTVGG